MTLGSIESNPKLKFTLEGREITVGGPTPTLREGEKLVRNTLSLCPECYRLLPAIVFERDGKIWIRRVCPEHGEIEEVYWGDSKLYYKAMEWSNIKLKIEVPNVEYKHPCPFSCGLCPLHENYTSLANIVLTNRCNLTCWYCLPGDQEILVREKGSVKLISLKELAKNKEFSYKVNVKGIEGEYAIPEDLEALSCNLRGEITWSKVKKIFRRRYKGIIYVVKTSSGKEVKVTPEHRLIVYTSNGLMRKEAKDLSIGDKLLSIRKIPKINGSFTSLDLIEELRCIPRECHKRIYAHGIESLKTHKLKTLFGEKVYQWKRRGYVPLSALYNIANEIHYTKQSCYLGLDAAKYSIPVVLKVTPELAKLIGYFISDGHYTSKDLRITAKDEEIREDIINAIRSLGLPYSMLLKEGKAPQIVIGSRLLRLIFKYVFKIPEKAPNKRLPRQVFEFPLEAKLALISGLFNGDGYVVRGKRHLSIGYASTSKGLIRDIYYLLASLGIFSRIRRVTKERNKLAKHDLYKLYIAGKDLVKLVSLISLKKSHREKLYNLNNRKEVKVKKLGDLIIDEVISIRTEYYEGLVYDLEVDSPSHNFIANDGILISNCFFYAEKAGFVYEPSLETLREMIRVVKKQHPYGGAPAVQLTGGEPTLRDDLVDIVKMLKEEGIRHIQLNTNGLVFSYEDGDKLARQLRKAGVNTVYLSFDGVSPKVNFKNHWEIPYIFENFRKGNMTSVVLVPTVIRGWNTDELGAIIKFAAENIDIVRGVNFQPVSLTGLMPRSEREKYRITIPEVIKMIEEQTNGEIPVEAWYPVPVTIPLSRFIIAFSGKRKLIMNVHPACGMATYVYVDKRGGEVHFRPISEFVDIEGFFNYLNEKVDEMEKGANRYIVGLKVVYNVLTKFIKKPTLPDGTSLRKILFNIFVRHSYDALAVFHYKFLFLGMMHFMDLYNYDVERVRHCAIHYVTPDKRVIPFCAFNVIPDLYRDAVQKRFGIDLKEWVKIKGFKSWEEAFPKHKRDINKLTKGEVYKKTYANFKEYLSKE